MKRLIAVAGVLALAACGKSIAPQPPSQEDEPVSASMAEEPEDLLKMTDINLYLHDPRPTDGAPRKPTLWIRADDFTVAEGDLWRFHNAQATIYGENEADSIRLEADQGVFEEDVKATLTGAVRAQVGDMHMQMQDIEYTNPQEETPAMARTDGPVTVASPTLDLKASSMRFYPDSKTYELTDVSGTIAFERTAS
ncbi:MAG: LPS export ABC transporter periplasmic protein LptC [Candidatus Hydrogenedentes bacterium]|nr:LPS export ABC transporter periplasmic protein LptC [Candidatus Hydrogenedentota bacterium]